MKRPTHCKCEGGDWVGVYVKKSSQLFGFKSHRPSSFFDSTVNDIPRSYPEFFSKSTVANLSEVSSGTSF